MASVRQVYSPIARPRRGLVKGSGLPSIIWSRAPRGLMLCAPLSDPRFIEVTGNFGRPDTISNAPLISTRHGSGIKCAAGFEVVSYKYTGGQPPSRWWIEAIVEDISDTTDGSICGWNQNTSGSDSTFDRQINSAAPNGWQSYLFDGAAKSANAGVFAPGKTLHIIGTTDGTTLWCYTRDLNTGTIYSASTVVSNGGFTGYTSPVYFCIGRSSNVAPWTNTRNSENIVLVNFGNVALSQAEIMGRFLDPFGFLQWPKDLGSFVPSPVSTMAPRGWFDAELIGSKAWFG